MNTQLTDGGYKHSISSFQINMSFTVHDIIFMQISMKNVLSLNYGQWSVVMIVKLVATDCSAVHEHASLLYLLY